jgi:hypothetical protein
MIRTNAETEADSEAEAAVGLAEETAVDLAGETVGIEGTLAEETAVVQAAGAGVSQGWTERSFHQTSCLTLKTL